MGAEDQDDAYDVNEATPAPTTTNGDEGAASLVPLPASTSPLPTPFSLVTTPSPSLSAHHPLPPALQLIIPSPLPYSSSFPPFCLTVHHSLPLALQLTTPFPLPWCLPLTPHIRSFGMV